MQSSVLKRIPYFRYLPLVREIGAPTEEELTVKDTSLKSTLLSVKVRCPDQPSFREITKKLPPGLTVQKLKLVLQRPVQQKAHQLKLSYVSKDETEVEVQLDNEMRDLFFYSIENGDIIFVRW